MQITYTNKIINKFIFFVLILIFVFFSSFCHAEKIYSYKQIDLILQRDCNVDPSRIFLFDREYKEYDLRQAISKASKIKLKYKDNIFDCDDIAMSVDSIITRYIAKKESGPAIMFGLIAITNQEDLGHMANIFIIDDTTYIYDHQTKKIYLAAELIKKKYQTILILL